MKTIIMLYQRTSKEKAFKIIESLRLLSLFRCITYNSLVVYTDKMLIIRLLVYSGLSTVS